MLYCSYMNRLIKLAGLVVLSIAVSGCIFGANNIARTESFNYPDIKDDFCGVDMDFRYCKCAFHGEYCDDIGMSKREADNYVQEAYDKWIADKLADFSSACTQGGGFFDKDECSYCESGFVAQGQECVEASEVDQTEPKQEDGLLGADCKVKPDVYDQTWKKYSDIDAVIPYEDRSWEAKQVYDLEEKRIALMVEGFNLETEQEADKQTRAVLEEYRQALVQNIKTNLLKSFWRLAWITYSTIDSGKGLGKTYSGLLEEGIEDIGAIAKGITVIQGLVPSDSALTIDTETVSGKVKSVSVNTALEAFGSLGDPVSTATALVQNSITVNYPSADLTDEEIAILKSQHISKGAIDAALVEGDAVMAARTVRMAEIETEIASLSGQITEAEQKEKDRTKFEIEYGCLNTK